ncbi:MAG: uracil-DNA glycosylase [Burkholderiales bacterium]|nr:uracil-DNA glycosylase [Burkholderiales bacterium]
MGLGPVWVRRHGVAAGIAAGTGTGSGSGAASDVALGADSAITINTGVARASNDQQDAALAAMDWDPLEASIRECTRCGLCEGRQHAVPGVGDRAARSLFVGEGPGRNEDLQGEPFVGPAGQLLDNMLRALDLARGKDTYIANIVKCRPVGADGRDRPPTPDEVDACMPYLRRQIALIRPQVIIALGKTAAVSLLGLPADTALAGLRGEPREFDGIPLVITYHPAYLLRQPADKAKTWRDLCLAKHIIDGD